MHHQHAVAHAEDFFHFAGGEQDRNALGGEFFHQAVDFLLGPDIDASGGLVEEQHLGFEGEPFSDDHLLLVATREKLDHLAIAGGLDAQRLDHLRAESLLASGIAESVSLVLPQAG